MSVELGILLCLIAAGITLTPRAFRRTEAAVKFFERLRPEGKRRGRMPPANLNTHFLGKLDDDLEHDGSAQMSVFTGDPLSEADNAGDNITVHPWKLADATKIPIDSFVIAALVNGRMYVIYSDTCPVAE